MRALLALVALLQSTHVQAQPGPPFDLTWSAPKGCPDAEQVRAQVHKLAAGAHTAGAPLRAEATVTRDSAGELHLHLVIRAEQLQGERHIVGRSCRDLAAASAVALALLLRSTEPLTSEDLTGSSAAQAPDLRSSAPTSAPAASAQAAVSAAQSSASTSVRATSPRVERSWRGLLQLPLLTIGVGPLHRASYGVALAAGMSIRRWLWLAEGKAWLPQRTTAEVEGQRYHADVQRFAGGLRGCRAFLWSRFQLAPCLAVSVEHMQARGSGPQVAPREATTTWIAAGLGLQVRVPLARWLSLVMGIELQIQTSRPVIAIADVGVIEQLAPVAGLFTLAPEWIL